MRCGCKYLLSCPRLAQRQAELDEQSAALGVAGAHLAAVQLDGAQGDGQAHALGYVTATLATFFVGRDAENPEAEVVGAEDIAALRDEIRAMRLEIRASREPGTDVRFQPRQEEHGTQK